MKDKGYVQVYTGDGKGKTTACMGLALRAAGAGYKVFIGQFMKGSDYSELKAFSMLAPYVEARQLGMPGFVFGKPSESDLKMASDGLKLCREKLVSGDYDVVITDEINVALSCGLLSLSDVLLFMDSRPENVELVMTGRNAAPEVVEKADLVTEMREIKHYYRKGVQARTGIEK